MVLSDDQIERLFQFTKEQGVYYYDVQIELVDHLATNIEAAMAADEMLTFPEAIRKAFDSFGVAGFEDVCAEKAGAANTREYKMLMNEAKQWLGFHRLMLLLALGSLIFFLGTVFEPVVRVYVVMALSFGLYGYSIHILFAGTITKNLLLLSYTGFALAFAPFSPLLYVLNVEIWRGLESKPIELMIVPVLIIFAVQISLCNVRRQLKQEAQSLYPEAFVKPSAATTG
jgi:hypothetical protein